MASTQGELEEQLVKAGNSLLELPSSDDELLSLLDQIEHHLSNVEQSPSKSMQTALTPCVKALVANGLLRHPNVDVKVAVATCISEVTRITAPEAPYDDDKMKDIFELIVSSFEDLSDKSSRSYSKRTLILETVAKVRSCVVMLDLECDGLIVKMFQHFLKSIRDYHPENVFTSMETIMSLVLEESEDISVDLICPILSTLKKDNKDFPPIAQKLGERVFENCAKKLKSCLVDAKKSLGLCLDDYSDIVGSICDDLVRENNGDTGAKQEVEESKLPDPSSEGEVRADDEKLAESSLQDEKKELMAEESVRETSPGGEGPVVDGSGTSVLSNGISESKTELKLDNVTEASQKLDEGDQEDKSSDANVKSNEADDLDGGKIVASEIKADQTTKKRGRKPKSSTISTEPSDSSLVDGDKETERLGESTTLTEEIHGSPKDPSHEATLSSDNEEAKISPPEKLGFFPVNPAPFPVSGSEVDEGRPKRVKSGRSKKKEKPVQEASPTDEGRSTKKEKPIPGASPTDDGRSKKKEKPIQEASPTDDGRSKKKEKSIQEASPTEDVSDKGANDSEVKPAKRSGKKAVATGKTSLEKTSPLVDTSKSKGVTTSDSEGKLPEQSGKKTGKKDNTASEPSTKKEDKKKRGRKPASEKPTESSAKDDDKETLSSPRLVSKDGDVMEETPKLTSKRKRGQGKENDKETPKPHSKSSKDEDLLEETPKASSKTNRNKGKEKASDDNIEYGEELVGSKVQVWWPEDETFYEGVIDSYDHATKKHKVAYSDGEIEILHLRDERWEIIGGDSLSDEEQATGGQSPKSGDPSSEKPKKKKAKTGSQSSKQGKRAEEAPSGRSKRVTPKSGRESKDEVKAADDKAKDKSASKSEADSGLKGKDRSKKTGGKTGEASKTTGKSKDVDSSTPKSKEGPAKTAAKDTPEAAAKSKGKSSKSGLKTDTNSSEKEKSTPVKTKEAEGSKKTSDKGKTSASGKKKSPEDAKSQELETKSGKKRGRGSRH